MKVLNGLELAGYIKERQARQVRALRQADGVVPKLAIIKTTNDPVIATYVRMKQSYAEDILVETVVHHVASDELFATIRLLNDDASIHGIIIQLPLEDESQTEEAVNAVASSKDVDGLGQGAEFIPATPMAIDWLLAGYNVTLKDKKIALVGNGRLVGAPLAKLWRGARHDVEVYDRSTEAIAEKLRQADIIVSAAGVPGLITTDLVKEKAVVVDAATSAEHGKIVGDVSDELQTRDDLTITPTKGGVGPLTVCALFDNVIRSARLVAEKSGLDS